MNPIWLIVIGGVFGVVLGAPLAMIGYWFVIGRKQQGQQTGNDELQNAQLRSTKMEAERDAAQRQLETEKTAAGERLTEVKDAAEKRIDDAKKIFVEQKAELDEVRIERNSLKASNAKLETTLKEKQESFDKQFQQLEESKKQLTKEFENLANRIFEEKDKAFSKDSKTALENLLKPFGAQINDFRKRVDVVHTEATESNAAMKTEIQHIAQSSTQISNEATNLAKALKGDKKTTGNWGEDALETTLQLSGLEKDYHYEKEKSFKDADDKWSRPDFILKLPDGKRIVIDSKASIVGYDAAVAAETEEERNLAMKTHIVAVRDHIDALSKKKYDQLEGIDSPSFVLMFMPVEPAYIEAMKHDRGLFNYGYRKNVVMVSHTTLLPLLHTTKNLWQLARGNKEAREISDKAGDIFNTLCLVAERLKELGGSLNTTVGHYNNALTGFAGQQGLHGKVKRFKELSAKVNKTFPEISRLHKDVEIRRLENIKAIAPPSENT